MIFCTVNIKLCEEIGLNVFYIVPFFCNYCLAISKSNVKPYMNKSGKKCNFKVRHHFKHELILA